MLTSPPRTGPLIDWLRNEAKAPFEVPRGDVGDQVPLQWLPEMAEQDSRVAFAVRELLQEGDEVVTDRLLQVATTAAMRKGVADALANGATTKLKSMSSRAESSMLGRAVRSLRVPRGVQLGDATLQVLHGIDRPEHGWPSSLAIGLAADASRFMGLVVPTLARCTPEQAHELTWAFLANADEAAVDAVVNHVGAHAPPAARASFGEALERDLQAQDKARQTMQAMGVSLPPKQPGNQRWQRYAAALGVQP